MTDFIATKAAFHIPPGIIYLDGNSLGPLPRSALSRVSEVMQDEWGKQLIRAWNTAGWMAQPGRVGDRIARLIGAAPNTVVMGETLSIKVYQALYTALEMRRERKVILSDCGNFPSDLYMAQGLIAALDRDYELRVVEPEEVAAAIDPTVAVTLLTEVDYRTGRIHSMAELTRLAHEAGALTVWDLAHSAGALSVDLSGTECDFAVGCTYKYLNGGPGSPAFIYVAPRHIADAPPALSGWLGHEAPFAFDLDYRPDRGIDRMRVGTPPVIGLAVLESALDIWDDVDIHDVRTRSIELCERFIAEVEAHCPEMKLVSPRQNERRGSQVSFSCEHGYAVMQALIAEGVIGDFRAPDVMRFGLAPLYIDHDDIDKAVQILANILHNRTWDQPCFHTRLAVT